MDRLHVAHLSSEVAPFALTGGLGEVVGSLPVALAALGIPQTVVLPLYRVIDRAGTSVLDTGRRVTVTVGKWRFEFRIFQSDRLPGVRTLLLDCPSLFDRDGIYSAGDGPDDNDVRFYAFGRAAIRALRAFPESIPNILHVHDWQAGMAVWEMARKFGRWMPSVVTIHNIAMQGNFAKSSVEKLGLPWEDYRPDGFEFWDRLGFLKSALTWADRITTVSPTYAREILSEPQGFSLDPLLRHRSNDLSGILNGIDVIKYDPRDRQLAQPFDAGDLRGKLECEARLRASCGFLEGEPGKPRVLASYVGRLSIQKGIDWLVEACEPLVRSEQIVVAIVGSGEPRLQEMVREFAHRYPRRVACHIGFNANLARDTYAGSSLFLMPSQFEPCGLAQMIAMRYGTIPVVRRTGGLADTVQEGVSGFEFRHPSAAAFKGAIERALATTANPEVERRMRVHNLKTDFSWQKSARQYGQLYGELWKSGNHG